jgi:hypothetical protein
MNKRITRIVALVLAGLIVLGIVAGALVIFR